MRKSVKAAVAGMSAAVSVALLFMSGFFYVFTYVAPMIVGMLICALKKTFSSSTALCVYLATSILSLILVPDKESALIYILFFGYYPLIKRPIEKIKHKIFSIILKFAVFNVSLLITELISVFVFNIPFFEDGVFSATMLALFTILMNIVFVLNDIMLSAFIKIYERKLEKVVLKLLK